MNMSRPDGVDLDSIGIATWEWTNTDDPTSFQVSPGVYELMGYRPGEIVFNFDTIMAMVSTEDHARMIAALHLALKSGDEKNVECRIRNKHGEERWYLVRGRAIAGNNGGASRMVGAIEDITKRKHSEMAAGRLAAIVESSDDAIVGKDLNGIINSWNAGAERIFGYSANEMVGTSIMRLIPVDRQEEENLILDKIRRGEKLEHLETQRRTKDGQLIDVSVTVSPIRDAAGEIIGVSKIERDITARKQAELASNWLAAIVESSQDAIIGKDLNSIIISWNIGAEMIFGYSAEEMIGTSILRLIPADRQHEERGILEKIIRGEKITSFETLRKTKDGRLIHVRITISPIRDATGKIIGASKIARDITKLKKYEREIERLSRLYDALSQVNQAIVRVKTRAELFQKVCAALVERGGFRMAWIGWHDPETQLLVPVAECGDEGGYLQSIKIYADDRPEGRGPAGMAFREGRPYISNDMFNDPAALPWQTALKQNNFCAGGAFPVQLKGRSCGVLFVYANEPDFFQDREIALLVEAASDVSFALDNFAHTDERWQAEADARSEKLFSDTMIESMPGIIYFYNEQGQFLRWNKNFEIVSGYSGAEISRMSALDFLQDQEKQAVETEIAEVFQKGESFVEASLLSKDGKATPYFFTGRRVVFNEMLCLVGMGIDISKRMQAEAALREMNENLERTVAERTSDMQAALLRAEAADRVKSAFLATMSHELRTPMNSIIGFTGIVLQGLAGPLNPEQTRQLGMVQGSARHLLELINDVLDISKIEAGQLEVHAEPFDLRTSLDRVITSMRPMAEKKDLALDAVLPLEIGMMVSDRRRVEQILLNLLDNAIKFTNSGSVTLTADIAEDFQSSPDSTLCLAVRIRIADTGIGIRPEELALLFQPFHQIDAGYARQREGTGLGLAICRRLSALMGGEITVVSVWTKGSEFTVTLPLRLTRHP